MSDPAQQPPSQTEQSRPRWPVILGSLLAGIGLIVLFRHQASLGGVNILALYLQQSRGWRAGYVQLVVDVLLGR